ncbi:MAG: Fic family protein [Varibaculum cambriense]|nr:Fic family protein [Varibaculum cambriense]
MKTPATPPDYFEEFVSASKVLGGNLASVLRQSTLDSYDPWDKFRHQIPPAGLTISQWWGIVRLQRVNNAIPVALKQQSGEPFWYCLPPLISRECYFLSQKLSSLDTTISAYQRHKFIYNGLTDEAICSAQLEGASTSRRVARQLLEQNREPRDLSERMIVNNYLAMENLQDLLGVKATPDFIKELHRTVTEGTLDIESDVGKIQSDQNDRVKIFGDSEQIIYVPPPARELPARMEALCDFINEPEPWMHPLLKAMVVHFMVGYDHYFADGNGRTARSLFYWMLLKAGFPAARFLVVSALLKEAPAQYARAFLNVEYDGGDLTYFLIYQLKILRRAVEHLEKYLADDRRQAAEIKEGLKDRADLNNRQIDILLESRGEPETLWTAQMVADRFRVSRPSGHGDLSALEEMGVLRRGRKGRRVVWRVVPGWEKWLSSGSGDDLDS